MGCMSSRETRHPQSEIPRLCFFDVQIGGEPAGRLVVELQHDLVPLTCANFRALCSGAKGWGYKGTKFHRIIPGTCVQGGNCGESIYGKYFKDESFKVGHLGRGTVYMANEDEPDTNASQFFICLAEKSSVHLKHVAFGRVLSGLDVVDRMEACGVEGNGHTDKEVLIADCGLCSEGTTVAPGLTLPSAAASPADSTRI